MTATQITANEVFEGERNADFRLSARQRDMLRTLNTLFDELCPALIEDEDSFHENDIRIEVCDVSRTGRG
jgi:hypothetical protein